MEAGKIPNKKRLMIFIDTQNLMMACMNQNPSIKYSLPKLVEHLIEVVPNREISDVFLYSAISPPNASKPNDGDRHRRQLGFFEKAKMDYGYQVFTKKTVTKHYRCRQCDATWSSDEHKGVDVALATDLIVYGLTDQYDVAIIVSGDSDFGTAINKLRSTKPSLRIEVSQFSDVLGYEIKSAASRVHKLDEHASKITM